MPKLHQLLGTYLIAARLNIWTGVCSVQSSDPKLVWCHVSLIWLYKGGISGSKLDKGGMRRFRKKPETSSAAVGQHILRIKWHAGGWVRCDGPRRVFGNLDEKLLMRKKAVTTFYIFFRPQRSRSCYNVLSWKPESLNRSEQVKPRFNWKKRTVWENMFVIVKGNKPQITWSVSVNGEWQRGAELDPLPPSRRSK